MLTKGVRSRGHHVDEENPYWISFSDIMAGLLVIFVLAAVALIVELEQRKIEWDQKIQELAKAEQVRKDLLREVEAELNDMNIPVKITDNDTVLRIPEDVLTFKSSRFDIPKDAHSREITRVIGEVLHAAIARDQRWQYLDTIFVEGHTDSERYDNDRIKGNWGLSTFRAISLWDYWNASLPEGERLAELVNHDKRPLFSVSGYAETRPEESTVDDLFSPESLSKNRRIDIRITVRRPQLDDLAAIKANMR